MTPDAGRDDVPLSRAERRRALEDEAAPAGTAPSGPGAVAAGAAAAGAAGAATWASRDEEDSSPESERIASAADYRDEVPAGDADAGSSTDVYQPVATGIGAGMSRDSRQGDDTADLAKDTESPSGEWGGPRTDAAAAAAETSATAGGADDAGADGTATDGGADDAGADGTATDGGADDAGADGTATDGGADDAGADGTATDGGADDVGRGRNCDRRRETTRAPTGPLGSRSCPTRTPTPRRSRSRRPSRPRRSSARPLRRRTPTSTPCPATTTTGPRTRRQQPISTRRATACPARSPGITRTTRTDRGDEGAADTHIVWDTDAYASTEPLRASEAEPAPDLSEDADARGRRLRLRCRPHRD